MVSKNIFRFFVAPFSPLSAFEAGSIYEILVTSVYYVCSSMTRDESFSPLCVFLALFVYVLHCKLYENKAKKIKAEVNFCIFPLPPPPRVRTSYMEAPRIQT